MTDSSILVVDDEPEILGLIAAALQDEGWRVATAADGIEAVSRAEANKPALIVLDLMLPGLSGLEVAGEIHRLYGQSVPIVIISADGRGARLWQEAGAFAFLNKPFDLDELISVVRQGLRG